MDNIKDFSDWASSNRLGLGYECWTPLDKNNLPEVGSIVRCVKDRPEDPGAGYVPGMELQLGKLQWTIEIIDQ